MRWMIGFLLMGFSLIAAAQAYPAKPVRIVVTAAPGGSDDFMGRILAKQLTESTGRQFLVENRPGGGAVIGRQYVARAAPDGYTLLIAGSAMAALPTLYPTVKLDLLRDFTPISLFATYPLVLVVHPTVPAKTAKDIIALARKSPGKLSFGSSGIGQGPHLAAELFKSMAKIDMLHVAYKGSGPGYVDLMAGRIDLSFGVIAAAMQYIKLGKLRPLGVTSAKRTAAAMTIPTISETGLPGYDFPSWMGFYGPAGMPEAVVAKLNAEVRKMIVLPEVRTPMLETGLDPAASSPEELRDMLKANIEKLERIITTQNIKLE
ncbi:MAG: tripartite tricarboxylate transporter substrate binding protein [Burkholderiales bacterium]|nr:tripartite tricarboxylate transporter substrate binding protein [Burkholderiales bacterium]